MAAPAMPAEFDPLIDLDGLWTTRLADDYLPDPRFPAAKYECINGRLIVSPTEVGANSWGEIKLARLVAPAAEAAGYYVYGTVNLTFHPGKWIQPDVTVLHSLPETDEEDKWVPAGLCTMAVEFVSPGSRQQDYVNKPEQCARGGVAYFMQVEIVRRTRHASVTLLKLVDGGYQAVAAAKAGQRFEAGEPFEMRFDPAELLP
ncbi:MAG: Uma2 family endonuclease [Micromonosporaceae bacterium]|nr:Uma2 family endonuclease [Micromonosporaceae bacterium]